MSDISMMSSDKPPVMSKAPDTSVKLIRGIKLGNEWLDTAVVREMTGGDEEFLAEVESRTGNYGEYSLALLKRAVVSLGETDIKETPNVLNELIVGDRDLLFLAIIRATYGKVREFKVICPHCSQSNDLLIDLYDDFPIEGNQELARKPIEVTLKDGSVVLFNHPTSDDSARVGKLNKNLAAQNTMMIARCAQVSVPNKEEWARNLSIADRSTIITAIFDAKVGPTPREVNAPCAHCGEEITLMFDWVSLLFG